MTTAIVLSGGGNLGAMQAGSVVALFEAGIKPDLFVGTSVGAMNSAFLATHPGLEGASALRDAWAALRRAEAVQLDPLLAFMGFFGLRDHLVSAKQLRGLLAKWIPIDRFEESTLPFGVVATDALSGDAVVVTRGEVGPALAASSAIPGIFPPVRVEGRWLVDGSLSSNHPVLEAQELGADEIYLVTTVTAPRTAPPRGAVAVAMNSVSLLTTRVARLQLAEAHRRAEQMGGHIHAVPSAEPLAPGPFDYRRSAELAEQAYRRTKQWLSEGLHPVGPAQSSESIVVPMANGVFD
jgi:NTE family protein